MVTICPAAVVAVVFVQAAEQPSGALDGSWLFEPVALDDGVDPVVLPQILDHLRAALGRQGVLHVGSEFFERGMPEGVRGSGLLRARSLLQGGEELFLTFRFAPAAASLAEAAGLFTAALAELRAHDLEALYRARLLEGVAWLEAGQADAAIGAFEKLITIRPEFEPDPAEVPPRGREFFRQARVRVRAEGLAAVSIRSTPPGASVILDGIPRGSTPIDIVYNLPPGNHGVRLVLAGYQQHTQELSITAQGENKVSVQLIPKPELSAWRRIRAGAKAGDRAERYAADFALLERMAGLRRIILVGVHPVPNAWVVTARSWQRGRSRTASVQASAATLASALDRLVLALSGSAADAPPGIAVDFDRALLGVLQTELTAAAPPSPVWQQWWFWSIAGAVVAAGGVTVAAVALSNQPMAQPGQARFILEF